MYMDALRFGVESMPLGITINKLKSHLGTLGWTISDDQSEYFQYWFFTNFYHPSAFQNLEYGNTQQVHHMLKETATLGDVTCPMTADAYDTFLDFEKLERAKIDTKKATNLSLIAIGISAVLALIQIILQIFCGCN